MPAPVFTGVTFLRRNGRDHSATWHCELSAPKRPRPFAFSPLSACKGSARAAAVSGRLPHRANNTPLRRPPRGPLPVARRGRPGMFGPPAFFPYFFCHSLNFGRDKGCGMLYGNGGPQGNRQHVQEKERRRMNGISLDRRLVAGTARG